MGNEDRNKNMTIVAIVFGVLFSLIGFFGSFTLNSIKDELKELRADMKGIQREIQTVKDETESQDSRLSKIEDSHKFIDKNKN